MWFDTIAKGNANNLYFAFVTGVKNIFYLVFIFFKKIKQENKRIISANIYNWLSFDKI